MDSLVRLWVDVDFQRPLLLEISAALVLGGALVTFVAVCQEMVLWLYYSSLPEWRSIFLEVEREQVSEGVIGLSMTFERHHGPFAVTEWFPWFSSGLQTKRRCPGSGSAPGCGSGAGVGLGWT